VLDLFLNAVKRRLVDERGIALPLALGVTVITSSLCAGIFSYATTNQGAAHRATADQRAYGLAEAGLSYAVSTLQKADDDDPYYAPADTAVPETTVTFPDGRQFVYSGVLAGTTWTLQGRGIVPNPSGPDGAPVVRRVSLQANVTTTTTGDIRPYDYLFIDQPSGCFTITNTVTIEVALYVRGDLCLENNTLIASPAVHVLGNVRVNSPQASIGTSSSPIPDFSISEYCYRDGTLTACDASSTSRVWASPPYGTSPPEIAKPTADFPYWYANADLGPMSQGTCTGFFDNDTTMNVSLGQINLTPSTAYDCYVGPVSAPTAQIKWTPGQNPSKPGTLKIKGTIFLDANIMWENLSLVKYEGRATIYTSGKVTLKNQTDVCGVETCDEDWDPNENFLTLVVGSMTSATDTTPDTVLIDNFTTFQGAIYAVNDYTMGNNTTIWGPVIARNADLSNSSLFKPLPDSLDELPPGVPSDTVTVSTFQLAPGSYAG
jgi:Tfp pilus assembly protein PilX